VPGSLLLVHGVEPAVVAIAITESVRLNVLPEAVIPLAGPRQDSIEIATAQQSWKGDDHLVVARMLPTPNTTSLLSEVCSNGVTAIAK
jgi:hypothetical protein